MQLFKLVSLSLATIGLLLGVFSLASGSENEDDLLDPSLDQPLPQYESTNVGAFKEVPKVAAPVAKKAPPKVENTPPPRMRLPSGQRENMLAPNPLQSLLSGKELQEESSPSDVRIDAPKSKPATPKRSSGDVSPIIKKKPVADPGQLTKPPGYSSPFNPKPLVPQSSKTTSTRPSKTKTPSRTAKAKKKTAPPQKPELNYEIYRDQSVYPLDPRKPNNPCTQTQNCGCSGCLSKIYGLHGRPYQPREPGGYSCGKKCSNKRPQFSVYWPRPLSAKCDERNPACAAARYSGCQANKLIDCFDKLANFRVIDYHRTDNGYCGPGRDPYGCLGESKGGTQACSVQAHSEFDEPVGWYPTR